VQRFVVLELSNYYLDVAKDRLYVRGAASADRRCAHELYHV
jgi:isoleucyl-tRNA synthetase